MTMDLRDLPGPLGTEVRGLDLRRPLDVEQVERLRTTFDRRHLLLFPEQVLTGAEHVAFCRHFGPISPESRDGYGYVSNVHPDGILREGAIRFHSDLAFTPDPVHALSLYALEVPEAGAPTLFADASGVLDRMHPRLRARLEPLSIVNVYDFTLPTDRRMRERDVAPGSPIVERRMVSPHPRTGVPVVNANALQTDRVVGLAEDESESLLAEIFDALYAPDNVLALDWNVRDLVIWDNLAIQHERPDFPALQPRTMQRVCIHDKSLVDLVPNVGELLGR
jgi:alpha-ketoglutarate-dependent taurine dioxygenase